MANKFTNMLSLTNKEIRKERAKNLAAKAEKSMKKKVEALEEELLELKTKKLDLEDLNASHTTSLNVTSQDFNADKWAGELIDVNISIEAKEVEVNAAKSVYKEYFEEVEETTKED